MLVAGGPKPCTHPALCPCAGFARCESEAVAQIQHRSTAVQQQGLKFVRAAMLSAGPQDASWADKLVLQSCLEVSAADRRLHMLGWERLLSIGVPTVFFGNYKGRPGEQCQHSGPCLQVVVEAAARDSGSCQATEESMISCAVALVSAASPGVRAPGRLIDKALERLAAKSRSPVLLRMLLETLKVAAVHQVSMKQPSS